MNPKINRNLNSGILHLWPKFGDPSLTRWWVIVPTSSKWGNFWFEVKFDLEGQGQSPPKNNRDLNQVRLHLWSKFVDPSLNGWWVIAHSSKCLPHTQTDGRTDGHTDRQTQATTIPEGQNWPRVKTRDSKCLALIAQMVRAFGMNLKIGV